MTPTTTTRRRRDDDPPPELGKRLACDRCRPHALLAGRAGRQEHDALGLCGPRCFDDAVVWLAADVLEGRGDEELAERVRGTLRVRLVVPG